MDPITDSRQGIYYTISADYGTELRGMMKSRIIEFFHEHVPTIPAFATHFLANYNSITMGPFLDSDGIDRPVDVFREDLEEFNDDVFPIRLNSSQMEAAFKMFENESACTIGPTGAGKSLVVVFIALFNWIYLRRRTLILTTRRAVSVSMVGVVQRIWTQMKQNGALARYSINPHLPLAYAISKLNIMNKDIEKVKDVVIFSKSVPKETAVLISLLGNVNRSAVYGCRCDHIILDETNLADPLEFAAMMTNRTIALQPKDYSSYSTRPKHVSFFGDCFQISVKMPAPRMISKEVMFDGGFSLDQMALMIRSGLPVARLNRIMRGGHLLHFLAPAFYDYALEFTSSEPHPIKFRNDGPIKLSSCFWETVKNIEFVSLAVTDDPLKAPSRASIQPYKNEYSAGLVVKMIKKLVGNTLPTGKHLSPADIAVITPYKAQEMVYAEGIARDPELDGLRVLTCDRAPGIEKCVAIIDQCQRNGVGFINGTTSPWPAYHDRGRLLVSITRSTVANIFLGGMEEEYLTKELSPISWLYMQHKYHPDPRIQLVQYKEDQ